VDVVTCWTKEEVNTEVRDVDFKEVFGKEFSVGKELNVPSSGISFLSRLSWTNVHF
jgi:hypothetical protein